MSMIINWGFGGPRKLKKRRKQEVSRGEVVPLPVGVFKRVVLFRLKRDDDSKYAGGLTYFEFKGIKKDAILNRIASPRVNIT